MRLSDKPSKADSKSGKAKRPDDLDKPKQGNWIYYDGALAGFGCRVTATGARAFILNYRTRSGRERRYTIGPWPEWSVTAARDKAAGIKAKLRDGYDPLAEIEADRGAKTVADLAERYIEKHLPKKRKSQQQADKSAIAREILPKLKHLKVADVTFSDVEGLHDKITKRRRPYQANRVAALLSKMFSLAIKWGWRSDNPVRGLERNPEAQRERYLSGKEITALSKALAKYEDQQAANIIRLLLLTGARRGEVLAARWVDFDLDQGVWTKPSAHTKQKKTHRIPLSAPARQLLAEIHGEADDDAVHVFPSPRGFDQPRENIRNAWPELCEAAGIKNARLHDLRHTYASLLASSGLSLPIIGALLGHTQPSTTARYAHLLDDPLRQATETVAAIVTGKPSAEITPLKRGA